MQNYISAEEFLEQSDKIQKAFIDWWKSQRGDLFSFICPKGIGVLSGTEKSKEDLIPLLQMHQLIQFIEDKTECKITLDILGKIKEEEYQINLFTRKTNTFASKSIYSNLGNNLLQALWKVACEIAEA